MLLSNSALTSTVSVRQYGLLAQNGIQTLESRQLASVKRTISSATSSIFPTRVFTGLRSFNLWKCCRRLNWLRVTALSTSLAQSVVCTLEHNYHNCCLSEDKILELKISPLLVAHKTLVYLQ
jgi:hypothetical protein